MVTKSFLEEYSRGSSLFNSEEIPFIGGTNFRNIIVVLPAYEEEISIGSVVLLTKQYADNVIVVDDGSSDRTAVLAEKAGAEVVVHKTNTGKGGALKTGFEVASKLGADIIVTMDSDGQHNPSDIPKLVAPILTGESDLVIGSRYLYGQNRTIPGYRRIGQTILDKATKMNSGVDVKDSQSGFRAFAASIKNVFRFDANGMAIESEMLADAGRAGLRVKEVEIEVRYDVDCSTENPIKHGLGVLVKILKDMEYNRPLYYFTIPGIGLGAAGVYLSLYLLHTFYLAGNLDFGPMMLTILLVIVGVFMAFTGVMLHSMTVFMRQIKT